MNRIIAQRLAQTRFGRWALNREADLSIFRSKPSPRFYAGLVLVALSYLLGLPAVGVCVYLARQWEKPLVLLLGGGAIWVLIHLMFTAGAYLSGGNYVLALVRWTANRFLRKLLSLS
ncbi:MAG: hypothetical protein HY788_17525 [Deltaproteobacteria bacterium]|nr:hypothetical protein [Deltaproteobacteria bacterium]